MRWVASFNKIGWAAGAWLCLLGCGQTQPPAQSGGEVTFASHIAPLLYQHCMTCHRPGSAGPFSLISYEDAARRSRMLAEVTASRFMPPWPADPAYRHFVGEKVLTAEEIALFQQWHAQGAPPGDLSKTPAPPLFPEQSLLGKPDLVIEFPENYLIPGNNRDQFLFMKLPYEILRDTFVRAIEFVPGNRRLLHHMNSHLISYQPGEKKSGADAAWVVSRELYPVQEAYARLGILNDNQTYPELTPLVCSYLPGMLPVVYPEGMGGYRLRRQGALLLNDMHYGPSAIDTFDRSRFNIFFAPGPPERPVFELQLGTLGISEIVPPLVILPDSVMTFRTRAAILEDISLLTLNPHMHLLGKRFKAWAIAPTGDTIPLVHIPDWDFRWQYVYTFEHMLRLPKGSLIEVEGTYDNTRDNPYNPFDPPQQVEGRDASMRTTDEMLQFIITYTPYRPGDENIRLGERRPDPYRKAPPP